MKLRNLNAKFTRMERRAVDPTKFIDGVMSPSGFRDVYIPVDNLADAMGICFDCPLCTLNKSEWVHQVMIGFSDRCLHGTYSQGSGGDTRWTVVSGTGLDDLVLSPSILLGGVCAWHGFVGMSGVPPGEAA